MKLQTILIFLLIAITGATTALVYDKLPSMVPSHWNAIGEVDSYMKKSSHVMLFLGLSIGMPLLMSYLPKLDPKYNNIQKFEGDFSWFVVVLTGFMVSLYLFTTAYALGYTLPIQNFMIPALAILFFSIGLLMKKTKINYTIGFRVPWTLNSEKNWDLTHKIAAKTFMYGATAILLTLFLGQYAFLGFIIIVLAIVFIPMIYSYLLHRKGI